MKQRSFGCLVFGQCLANAGDVFYIVALISLVYSVTGSTLFVSLVPFTNTLTMFVSGLIAPVLLDRFSLKKVLVYSQLIKTLLLMALAVYAMVFIQPATIALLFLLVGLISFFDGWASPARSSMIPRLVPRDQLVKANSLVSITDQSIQLGGWALGGIILSLIGSTGMFWITFSVYMLSTVMMGFIVDRKHANWQEKQGNALRKAMVEGWQIIFKDRALRTIHLLMVFETVASTAWLSAVLYVFIRERLKTGVAWWGYLNTAFFIGMLLAGFVGYRSFLIKNRPILTVVTGSGMVCLTTLFFGFNTVPWVALLLIAANGIFDQLKGISLQVILQTTADDRMLPKIYSTQNALVTLVFGLSTVAAGAVSDRFNIIFTFIGASVLLMISFVILLKKKNTLITEQHETTSDVQ